MEIPHQRILNPETLLSHGNLHGRQAVLEILEAGLKAADPYNNILKLVRIKDGKLVVGCMDFEPEGSPVSGDQVYDLSEVDRIFVFGAGKGSQRAAKALEDLLGETLTGGHIIAKHGDDLILERIGVTFGAHPVPDEGCVSGCQKIVEMSRGLTKRDLVFTIAANGISSLLTLPVPGVTLEEVRQVTHLMQIERGAPTADLNPVRNHLDQIKGGRFAALIQPARAVHIVVFGLASYEFLMQKNVWLHNLPEGTTFSDAVVMLKRWDAWDAAPLAVRRHLELGDPQYETVKAKQFARMSPFRVFCVMPDHLGMLPAAREKAAELGFHPVTLATELRTEARPAGEFVALVGLTVDELGQPFTPPCALLTVGELAVTVGKETGVGGRNQEFVLSAALKIAGSDNIVIGAVDSDGTDGPGAQFIECCEGHTDLAGGIVDGQTVARAETMGVDIYAELRRHNATRALCKLEDGIVTTRSISMNDLSVTLILAR
jgi:glycerate-2-kinase